MTASLLKFGTQAMWNKDENLQQSLAEALAQYRELLAKGVQASAEEKENLFENFDEKILQDANQRYDTLSDEQKKQYAVLASIWRYNAGDNDMQIQDKDGKLILRGIHKETGLQMAIMSDTVSLVLAQDQTLTMPQVTCLRDFMDDTGFNVIQFPENIDVKEGIQQ